MPKTVHCRYVEGIVDSDESDSNLSKAVILYPTLSNYTKKQPNFDPFILTTRTFLTKIPTTSWSLKFLLADTQSGLLNIFCTILDRGGYVRDIRSIYIPLPN